MLITVLLLLLTIASHATAQQVYLSNWKTITSLREVRGAAGDGNGRIWVATAGGVAVVHPTTLAAEVYNNVNGLRSLDCTALLHDVSSNATYVGQRDGSIDVLSSQGIWTNISDIQRASQYPKRSISGFAQRGDTLAIATEFGIVLYNSSSRLFIETIDRIATFPEKTAVRSSAFAQGFVWAVVSGRLLRAPLSATTLRLPSAWVDVASIAQGLPDTSEPITHLAVHKGTFYAASTRGVFRYDGDRFTRLHTTLADINSLSVMSTGEVVVSTAFGVEVSGSAIPISWPAQIEGLHVVSASSSEIIEDRIVVFLRGIGFGYIDADSLRVVELNSPISNQFTDLSIDTKGWLWAATHTDGGYGGQGVSYFDGSVWRAVTTSSLPSVPSNGCYRVSSLPDGTTWIGTWGKGAVRCTHADTPSGIRAEVFNHTNSTLAGVAVDSTYILVSEVRQDRYGRTVILNEQSTDRLFSILGSDNTWDYRQNCANNRETVFRSLAVDGNGTVWCGSPDSRGLIGYNDRNTATTGDDICNKILSSNSQLQDNVINCLTVDQLGSLWIGTAKGLSVISSPWGLTNTSLPYVRRVSAMSTTYINDIFVDALNYKWIATNNGVFVLDESGIDVLATITTSTSPLIDNNVRSIVVDESTGLAYFGTLKGCSVARTSSMRPLPTFDVQCYPQPFRPGSDPQLVFDGLASDAEIRVMTATGIVVSAIQARGRQALWNGLDINGNPVPPGVYVASISSASAGSSAVIKFAITR